MTPDTFAVHLGGGAYLDASGNLVFSAPDNAQIYQAPAGFHLDAKQVQDVFADLSKILPSDQETKNKWISWGVPVGLVNLLGSTAGVASIIATAISVYAWAVSAVMRLMELMADDEGMSPSLAATLFSIKNQLQAQEQIERANKMSEMHAEFDGRIGRMRGLVVRLALEPTPEARAGIFADMRAVLDELAVPLARVRNQDWAAFYNGDAYKGRAFASELLVFQRSDGATSPVPQAPVGATHFDYRFGIPMLLFTATTFAALAQVAMPWFRCAGIYAGQLRSTANAIDRFVLRMQDESISRTHHSSQTVLQQRMWPIFEVPSGGGPRKEFTPPTLAVGAFDLVRYDDRYLLDRYVDHLGAGEDTGPRGLFDYHWAPPVQDLELAATAANDKAKADYAHLQVASGMFALIQTAGWLRFLSTPTGTSQTVEGFSTHTHVKVGELATRARSPEIFPVGVVEHRATLKRYEARSRVRITTQEPGYAPAVKYRIALRTIHSQAGAQGWDNQTYVGGVWRAEYEKTEADPRLNRLRTEFRGNSVLSEVVLYEGPSPADGITLKGEKAIRASTFDWYVPVVSPWSSFADASDQAAALAGEGSPGAGALQPPPGGVSIHLMAAKPMKTMAGTRPLATRVADSVFDRSEALAGLDASLEMAERRHVKTENVTLSWECEWKQGRLDVRLFGRPADRSYQVHVVVEETVYSGEVMPENIAADPLAQDHLREQLHTPFVAEMVNQIVFVPEPFFDHERKAIEAGDDMWGKFLRRFVERQPIGPGQPVEQLDRSIREMTIRSQSTSTLAAVMAKRIDFALRVAPEIWRTVIAGPNAEASRPAIGTKWNSGTESTPAQWLP